MSASFLTFFSAGLCTLVLATTLAEAGGRGAMFDKLDLDKDGLVTRGEAVEARGRWFERVDADADGYLTLEEMASRRGRGQGRPDRAALREAGSGRRWPDQPGGVYRRDRALDRTCRWRR